MQSQIVLDLRLLNAHHRARAQAPMTSDYVAKLIPAASPKRMRRAATPSDASSTWDEWLAVPADRPGRRFGFDA